MPLHVMAFGACGVLGLRCMVVDFWHYSALGIRILRTPWRQVAMDLKKIISSHPDFPKHGILFRDFAPVLGDPAALEYMADGVEQMFPADGVDVVVGIESRGFILATLMAVRYNRGMVMMRKAGKTPGATCSVSYELEYGSATLEMKSDSIADGSRVLICDDLLATGGTANAAVRLIEESGAQVAGLAFIMELSHLGGRAKIDRHKIGSLVVY